MRLQRIFVVFLIFLIVVSSQTIEEKLLSTINKLPGISDENVRCRKIMFNSSDADPSNKNYSICCLIYEPASHHVIKCLPSFIIAGTQKSGTTILSALLVSHPSVKFAIDKEVHFFDNAAFEKVESMRTPRYVGDYLRRFPELSYNQTQLNMPPIYGESSPFYIASPDACRHISTMIPNVKMIILLREPVSRAYSELQMKKRILGNNAGNLREMKNKTIEFDRCLREFSKERIVKLVEDVRRCIHHVNINAAHYYFYRSLYAPQLYQCFEYIPREQFFIVSKEEMEANPSQVLTEIVNFIGIPQQSNLSINNNFIKDTVHKYFTEFQATTGWQVKSNYEPMPDSMALFMKRFFVPFNKMLDTVLQRNFTKVWANEYKGI